jgi:hypothetical protein
MSREGGKIPLLLFFNSLSKTEAHTPQWPLSCKLITAVIKNTEHETIAYKPIADKVESVLATVSKLALSILA